MFKVFRVTRSQVVKEIFQLREAISCQLTKWTHFPIQSVQSAFSGTESIKFLGSKIREISPHEIT